MFSVLAISKARVGDDLDQPQPEVASVGIVIVGFDADTAVIVLELTLNKNIEHRGDRAREIKDIFAAGLAIERDLDELAAGLFDSSRSMVSAR